jgi:hypothetical protein
VPFRLLSSVFCFLSLSLLLFCSLFPRAAQAWNAAGHRQIAALAWENMNETARRRASALLRQHPDYPRWQKRQQEKDVDYGVFLEASTWADEIRHDARFHSPNEARTPPLPGFPDMLRHSDWHYQDEGGGKLLPRLSSLAKDLLHGDTDRQVYALPWLMHLVGDLHQPLHTGGRHDRGGNQMSVKNPFNPRQPLHSLHRYWDDLPGPSWLRGPHLEKTLPPLRALPQPAGMPGDTARWLAESRALLARQVYPAPTSGVPEITPHFHREAQKIAQRRIAAAGRRLGQWLNWIL